MTNCIPHPSRRPGRRRRLSSTDRAPVARPAARAAVRRCATARATVGWRRVSADIAASRRCRGAACCSPCCAVTVPACSGVPGSSAAFDVTQIADQVAPVAPDAPTPGQQPDQIVRGFIAASARPDLDAASGSSFAAARQYLTPEAQANGCPAPCRWWCWVTDTARASTVQHREPSRSADFRPGQLDTERSFHTEAPRPTQEMHLVQVDGEWRISDPPPELLLTSSEFSTAFRQRVLYFLDPIGHRRGAGRAARRDRADSGQPGQPAARAADPGAERRLDGASTPSSPASPRCGRTRRSTPRACCRSISQASMSRRRRPAGRWPRSWSGRCRRRRRASRSPSTARRWTRRSRSTRSTRCPRSTPTGWPAPGRWPPIRSTSTPGGAIVGLLDGQPIPARSGSGDGLP